MILDPLTLAAAFVLLSAMLGVLLLFAWTHNRRVQALGWWGATFCLIPVGIGMANFGQSLPSHLNLLMANAFVTFGYGALYAGCRRLQRPHRLVARHRSRTRPLDWGSPIHLRDIQRQTFALVPGYRSVRSPVCLGAREARSSVAGLPASRGPPPVHPRCLQCFPRTAWAVAGLDRLAQWLCRPVVHGNGALSRGLCPCARLHLPVHGQGAPRRGPA